MAQGSSARSCSHTTITYNLLLRRATAITSYHGKLADQWIVMLASLVDVVMWSNLALLLS